MYAILVYDGGISPGYLMRYMDLCEIPVLLDNIWRKDRAAWERSRNTGYIIAQSNSARKLKPSDILKFPWDDKPEAKRDTKEELERLDNEMNKFINNLNNGSGSGNPDVS